MADVPTPVSPSRTTCSSLLHELQILWDEIGENDGERDKMLLQLEQECLDIYRRKVEKTRKHKADLHQSLAESEAEIANLITALGERTSFSRVKGTLKEQLAAVKPVLEEFRLKKKQRMKEFLETQAQIARICAEIAGNGRFLNSIDPPVDEHDLTWSKLKELKSHLQELQSEKLIRLQKVDGDIHTIHQLSVVMSFDFFETVNGIHTSLTGQTANQSKSISDYTLAGLTNTLHSLKQEKEKRLQKLQKIGSKLVELWDLMDTPAEEQKKFDHITSLISSSVDDVSKPGSLAVEVIEQAEIEVERLNVLKASKMKELVMKRQNELEEIYREVHMDVDSDSARQILISLIDSGTVELSDLLANMDDQIAKAKEQASSRREILDRMEKWHHAAEEERWLDDYEKEDIFAKILTGRHIFWQVKDENRYSAGRGAHKNLKRAEKARILVSKIPSMVESLKSKIKAWELEKGIPFLYDKVPLLHMLEVYTIKRQEREEEKRRCREQKRLKEQLATEQEAIYGSRPSTKKPLGPSMNANNLPATPIARRGATPGRYGLSSGKDRRESGRTNAVVPVNYVALPKEEPNAHGS
ncbi:hypothetical protein CDL15_Pgr022389 [Punica granatum]|uniref:65-kDa microtubule-associated protein 5 n=1 Tax=Punica granatum TaxID=22663 RepID=A0A218XSP0_PUNGR|nr:hypothetical protein CDL15_Pgr022389 [Punica granatum]